MLRFSPSMALEPCQSIVEVARSDLHKVHMLRSDVLLETLQLGLSAELGATADVIQTQLRVCCCAVLAQLSTLPATAATLVGGWSNNPFPAPQLLLLLVLRRDRRCHFE